MKLNLKRGDEVVVIAGAHRGKRGNILEIRKNTAEPDKTRVVVEGVAMRTHHLKKSQEHPEGAIVKREGSLHYSNVMAANRFDARVAKRSGAAS